MKKTFKKIQPQEEEPKELKTFIIKSSYEFEIEAEDKDDAIDRWNESVEDYYADSNDSLTNVFAESLYAEELKDEPIQENDIIRDNNGDEIEQ